MWFEYQKKVIKNTMELEYESMSNHKMWVAKEYRKNFYDKQTHVDQCDELSSGINC